MIVPAQDLVVQDNLAKRAPEPDVDIGSRIPEPGEGRVGEIYAAGIPDEGIGCREKRGVGFLCPDTAARKQEEKEQCTFCCMHDRRNVHKTT